MIDRYSYSNPLIAGAVIFILISMLIAAVAVGLDSQKRIFSEKMRKERKKRGKEAKRWGKEAKLMSQSYGHIRDRFRMIMYFCY